ncbi:circularly permuted type 2 ATP-grasp protein [Spartinivicinus poritis]|uniref:Circularly permuted type 2 ATP-grasp protein n=1 Tax=Spartinivicinus poritis TaxID=2994640 RepID=A0ABT5UD74_9GAMM|nr:circularly permuted type 2 ATP-grasp protein [Spartinivicinus sp. A2-2]MDE1464329.1 circularly permuted type 2 ATP-grasp protein [Spartinivicinus sp. A2-2]
MTIDWQAYQCSGFFDELIDDNGRPRQSGQALVRFLSELSAEEMDSARAAAELAVKEMGITFTVYGEGSSIDRAWPIDIIPRIISNEEWQQVEAGLVQRVQALNLFIDDLYHDQQIIKDGVFPQELINKSVNFRPQCVGISPPKGIWAHICGTDLVRDKDGTFYVLEDNLRVPSGVSYMIENRSVMKRVFPDLFEQISVLPVSDYPSQLFDMLTAMSPRPLDTPEVVVLTPGIYNSAYFEHCYLAQEMGCELVEGRDLVVNDDDCVYMKTVSGLLRVDVIYRRIDDLFLDPEAFNPDSQLGVPGLLRAWRKGNVALVNAPGAGVADDKVVYTYVPDIIQYYLSESAILPNVHSYRCFEPDDFNYVVENIDKLVVKPANESGGYGLLIGPKSTREEQLKCIEQIKADPRNFIAQPTLSLSTVPTLDKEQVEGRHVDLRPFILSAGEQTYVTTGGLTRVALVKGSLVVNSSQGGGSKDTWIVEEEGL